MECQNIYLYITYLNFLSKICSPVSFRQDRHCENSKWHGTSYLSEHIEYRQVKSTMFSKRGKIRRKKGHRRSKMYKIAWNFPLFRKITLIRAAINTL